MIGVVLTFTTISYILIFPCLASCGSHIPTSTVRTVSPAA